MQLHRYLRGIITVTCLILASTATMHANAARLASTGHVTYLRAHQIGTGYGPPSDFLDAEVIVKLDSAPANAFGFQLRDSNNDTTLRKAMFDMLLMAYKNNLPVTIEYDIAAGFSVGTIVRVYFPQ